MCTGAARTQGVAACDLTTSIGGATTDADGAFTMTVAVARYPMVGGGRVDCATGNVDPNDYAQLLRREGPHPTTYNPASATCIVAVGELSNYDNSGGWPIAFAGEVFVHGSTTTVTDGSQAETNPPYSGPYPSTTTAPPSRTDRADHDHGLGRPRPLDQRTGYHNFAAGHRPAWPLTPPPAVTTLLAGNANIHGPTTLSSRQRESGVLARSAAADRGRAFRGVPGTIPPSWALSTDRRDVCSEGVVRLGTWLAGSARD
jgi:hypothetical protein